MKEHPILFSGPMVRAILEGRKTQTRRVIKPQPKGCGDYSSDTMTEAWRTGHVQVRCPYGVPGDRLWVRETWQAVREWEQVEVWYRDECPVNPCAAIAYHATDHHPDEIRWRPSIHMPRWASRILLEITDVRVQRLQEISEADAIAEGIVEEEVVVAVNCYGGPPVEEYGRRYVSPLDSLSKTEHEDAIAPFEELWDSINAARGYGWGSNPWVWAVSFRRIVA